MREQDERIISNLTNRCRLMCGQEAVCLDLPEEAGHEVHDALVADALEDWSDDEYMWWVDILIDTYGKENEPALLELYTKCHDVMFLYGEVMQANTSCI